MISRDIMMTSCDMKVTSRDAKGMQMKSKNIFSDEGDDEDQVVLTVTTLRCKDRTTTSTTNPTPTPTPNPTQPQQPAESANGGGGGGGGSGGKFFGLSKAYFEIFHSKNIFSCD